MTEAILLEGKKVGEKLRVEISAELEKIGAEKGVTPALFCVAVGDDPASRWYRQALAKNAKSLGVGFEEKVFDGNVPQEELFGIVEQLSFDRKNIHGVLVQDPLPKHIDQAEVLRRLNPKKDVEGIHPENLGLLVMRQAHLVPATALSCLALIESTEVPVRGKVAVIVGQSTIVGRPLQLLLGERRATTIVCNTGTTREQIAELVGRADIVAACCGQPRLVRGEWIKEGAIVVDAGTTEVDGAIVGDVDFEAARKRAKYISPVPGGVGPLTVLMLMKNLIAAWRWQNG